MVAQQRLASGSSTNAQRCSVEHGAADQEGGAANRAAPIDDDDLVRQAQFKDASPDREGTANQPWRQTRVGKHEQQRGYQVGGHVLKAALDACPDHLLARCP
jgi:hypothetical protein